MRACVDRAAAAGAGSPAELDARRASVSVAQSALMSRAPALRWIDGRRTARGLPRRDQVHLTSAGYELWSRRLVAALAPARAPTLALVMFTAAAFLFVKSAIRDDVALVLKEGFLIDAARMGVWGPMPTFAA